MVLRLYLLCLYTKPRIASVGRVSIRLAELWLTIPVGLKPDLHIPPPFCGDLYRGTLFIDLYIIHNRTVPSEIKP